MASSYLTYSAIAHFSARLQNMQARGENVVADDVLERVRVQLQTLDPELRQQEQLLTDAHMLAALRALRLQHRYSENIPEMMKRLGGFAPLLDLPAEVEADLISKFGRVLRALRCLPEPRSLSHGFIARKLLQEGGPANDAYFAHFPAFSSEAKREHQERVWEQLLPFFREKGLELELHSA
jgi:hypothetical protein